MAHGRTGDALAHAEQAFELASRTGSEDALPTYYQQLGAVYYQEGRLGEIEPGFDDAFGDYSGIMVLEAARAVIAVDAGNMALAERLHNAHLTRGFLPGDQTSKAAIWSMSAYVAMRLGNESSARRLAELLEPEADLAVLTQTVWLGHTRQTLAMAYSAIGEGGRALELLDQVEAEYAAIGNRVMITQVALNRAEMLTNDGRASEARAERQRARALAENLGLDHLAATAAGAYPA